MGKAFYKEESEPETLWINEEYRIQLNITGNCPLNCDFCYIKKNHSEKFLSLVDIKLLWRNLRKHSKKYGIKYLVTITGGDIFFHPEIAKILEFLAHEKTVIKVEPLINKFWKEEDKKVLLKLGKKFKSIQFNSDVVTVDDLEYAKSLRIDSAVKVAFYEGKYKTNFKKIKDLLEKFDNLFVATDLIIPQRDQYLEGESLVFNNSTKIFKMKELFEKEFGNRLKITSTTVKRIASEDLLLCPIPFSGLCVMPDGEILLCARYPHLKSGFNIKNFDLSTYVTKYSKLCSNFCLFENKYFCDFWSESENPTNFQLKSGGHTK
jgi:MoaA/NifB/PqqE/SkfB family radical SAM enzyme